MGTHKAGNENPATSARSQDDLATTHILRPVMRTGVCRCWRLVAFNTLLCHVSLNPLLADTFPRGTGADARGYSFVAR